MFDIYIDAFLKLAIFFLILSEAGRDLKERKIYIPNIFLGYLFLFGFTIIKERPFVSDSLAILIISLLVFTAGKLIIGHFFKNTRFGFGDVIGIPLIYAFSVMCCGFWGIVLFPLFLYLDIYVHNHAGIKSDEKSLVKNAFDAFLFTFTFSLLPPLITYF